MQITEPPSAPHQPRKHVAALAAALFALTIAVYAPTAQNDFVLLDDPGYVKNRHVRAGLTTDGFVWAFTREHSSNWHPLTWLSHMLDVQLFGQDAGKHHLVSVFLHALSAVLLFVFLLRATGAEWAALLVAGLFALHPQRVESVAWVAERKDVLSGLFFFLTLLAYERYARRPSAAGMALVVVTTVLGLLAKPMLVTLPFVLLLADVWPLERQWSRRLALEKLPLFLLVAGSSIVTLWAQSSGNAVRDLDALAFDVRLANAFEAWLVYLRQAVWPTGLAVFYPHPALVDPDHRPWTVLALVGAVLFVALCAVALRARRTRAWLFTGWFWYVGMLVPVSGLLQVGGQRLADRYTYLPLIGIYLAVVFGVRALSPKPTRIVLAGLGFVLVGVYGLVTFRHVFYWHDSVTLFERAVAVTEKNYVAHNNLGLAYMDRSEYELAAEEFRARLAISPAVGASVNLSSAYLQLGRGLDAVETLATALRYRPGSERLLDMLRQIEAEARDPAVRAAASRAVRSQARSSTIGR